MTTLASKLQQITERLQELTVWRPTERDPLIELDHWRAYAHAAVEQTYEKKRQLIESLIGQHEQAFMRQLTKQRALLNRVRQRFFMPKEILAPSASSHEVSILTDLQKIEHDIHTKLGRAEILVEPSSLNPDVSITISLKTYLSSTPPMYGKEPKLKSAHGDDRWRTSARITRETSVQHERSAGKQAFDYPAWSKPRLGSVVRRRTMHDPTTKQDTVRISDYLPS